MLFGNESIAQYSRPNIAVWVTMAFEAGVLNIGGFLACRRFVSHITGFAAFFGYELSRSNLETASGMLVVPLFFLLGALISGQLVDLRLKLHKKPKYYITFGIMFLLILAVYLGGIFGRFGHFGDVDLHMGRSGVAFLALLCLTCGILNGTVTTVSRSVLRTTHLTGPTTDLGIGIIRYLNRQRLGEWAVAEGQANLVRIVIIASFWSGSVLGAFLFQIFEYEAFLLPLLTSGGLFGLMVYFQVWKDGQTRTQATS